MKTFLVSRHFRRSLNPMSVCTVCIQLSSRCEACIQSSSFSQFLSAIVDAMDRNGLSPAKNEGPSELGAMGPHLSTAVAEREKSPSNLSLTNIFLWYQGYLNPKLEQLGFNLGKNIGVRKHAGKVRKFFQFTAAS